MQVDTQKYLRLVEDAGKLAFFDIEATGLAGDYNSVLVVSVKPYRQAIKSFVCEKPGDDRAVVDEASRWLERFDVWCSYYGKGFDVPMLQARALYHGMPKLDKRHHIDLFYTLLTGVKTSRKSQAHFLRWLGCPVQKMDMSPQEWNAVLADPKKATPKMVKRCESDVRGLQGLYEKTKHLIVQVTT